MKEAMKRRGQKDWDTERRDPEASGKRRIQDPAHGLEFSGASGDGRLFQGFPGNPMSILSTLII